MALLSLLLSATLVAGSLSAGGASESEADHPRVVPVSLAATLSHAPPLPDPRMHRAYPGDLIDTPPLDYARADDVIRETCMRCHNDRRMRGNMSLEGFDVERAYERRALAEAMIRKLRAGMMPPPGTNRPTEEILQGLAATLETQLDSFARANPDPGVRSFQRLNQAEYRNAIRDLLDLEIDPEAFLPPDTKSANFDNIADAQLLSPTLLDAYLNAAARIARLAVGDPTAIPEEATYTVPRLASQWSWVEGAPFGTRGGLSVVHLFPADGDYAFRIRLQPTPTGQLFGRTARNEVVEISVDGERVAVVPIDRFKSEADPTGMEVYLDERVHISAGPHRISAAFLPNFEGPVDDILSPVGHSLADTQIGLAYGVTTLPHLRDLVIAGPYDVTGVSETPSRRRIFACRPISPSEEAGCAARIISRLATRAYRRPLEEGDIDALLSFYREGAARGGFEVGMRDALQAILASPHFIFRIESAAEGVSGEGGVEWIAGADLASRLSFFLWGTVPDGELLAAARDGRLSGPEVLRGQVTRMLADPAAERLGARFAGQWLRLSDIEKVHPDAIRYPDYDQQLAALMVEETERFFNRIVAEDRSVLELLTADWTLANERLATHYGIPGVAGPEFRLVSYADARRRGLLGQGSILTLTSHANRTSPVLRGKWVMEVLLGTPPPPPPPDVPDLEATEPAVEGRMLTVREQLELHRESPSCNSCHLFIDPIGLALENFDVTGRWRTRDQGNPVDPSGELYDGTPLHGPNDLLEALVGRPEPFLRNFTENLMAYALGRRVEYYDMPTVRQIVADARERDYAITAFIQGVVRSRAFRMRRAEVTGADSPLRHP
ncbi:MAG: DUF1592 domain-containing protein [Longimicrobiales bacterium]|nr:DUF1592 domain-containing protein [Longimicrobiales bacterium]